MTAGTNGGSGGAAAETPPSLKAENLAEALAVDRCFRARLVRYAWLRFGIQPEDAADPIQETCLALLAAGGRVRNPEGFALAVFRRRCCAAIKEGTRRSCADPGLTAARVSRLDDLLAVRQALARLSPRRRALLEAHYFEGHTLRETGRICSIKEASTATLIRRALAHLRTELTRTAPS